MNIINKWNKKVYKIVKEENGLVTLERENGEQFTIQKSELKYSYIVEK